MINILVVEDNVINQLVAVKLLQRWGMQAMIANHGQEALTLIESKSFHLILMDLDMPVMDGYESTRRIREMDGSYFKMIPIIAFTASELTDAKGKASHSGMTDFVTKPLQLAEMKSTIDKYVLGNTGNENGLRPLHIDFDQYTDGDDTFKRELVSLMIVDIIELQKSIGYAIETNDGEIFLKACHKSKTTVHMVNDSELTQLLEELKVLMMGGIETGNTDLEAKKSRFDKLSGELVKSLSDPKLGQVQF